jgi:hypothetical protein
VPLSAVPELSEAAFVRGDGTGVAFANAGGRRAHHPLTWITDTTLFFRGFSGNYFQYLWLPHGERSAGDSGNARLPSLERRFQRLIEVGDEVVSLLNADRQADQGGGDAEVALALEGEARWEVIGRDQRMAGDVAEGGRGSQSWKASRKRRAVSSPAPVISKATMAPWCLRP